MRTLFQLVVTVFLLLGSNRLLTITILRMLHGQERSSNLQHALNGFCRADANLFGDFDHVLVILQ